MNLRRTIISIIILSMFFFTLLGLTCNYVKAKEYSDFGVKEGQRYIWTLKDIDTDKIENITAANAIFFDENRKLIYDINQVKEFDDGTSIKCEVWELQDEEDDDGNSHWTKLNGKPSKYQDEIIYFCKYDFDDYYDIISKIILFIPTDIKDFLSDAAANETYISADSSKITCNVSFYKPVIGEFSYNDDGILETLEVKYENKVLYKLQLEETTDIPWSYFVWIQHNLTLFIIIAAAVIGGIVAIIIIIVKKRKVI
ncbi:MAG: hypothetical protein ACTSPW_13915 [Promethearchaeota archaeon]